LVSFIKLAYEGKFLRDEIGALWDKFTPEIVIYNEYKYEYENFIIMLYISI
tara:strand:+ start:2155 stop:2307 length:153 start_codon:yes stop_codon:yes gene_type:complete